MRKLCSRLLAVLVCLLGLTGRADAHAVLTGSNPPSGAQLEQAPAGVEVRFNEPVEAEFTPLQVQNRRGERVDAGDARVHPSDRSVVTVSLKPSLPPGFYTVIYRVTSLDGHPVQGTLGFTVGEAAEETAAGPDAVAHEPAVPAPVSIVHGLVQLAIVVLAGLPPFLVLIWLPVGGSEGTERIGRWALGLTLALILLGLAEVSLYAVRASGEPFSLALLMQGFTRTRVGGLWLARISLGIVSAAALTLAPQLNGVQRWLAMLPGGALLCTLTLQSHANATGELLPIVADWLHLVALAPWAGGLAGFGLVVWPALAAKEAAPRRQTLLLAVTRFSRVAVGAVLVLTLTGVYGAVLHLPSMDALWTTGYGRSLAAKLLLLVPVLGLGAYNFVRKGEGPFRRAVLAEVGLMTAIFVAAGFLTSMPPANVEIASRQGPFEQQASAQGLQVTLRIAPNRVGFNQAEIILLQADGSPVEGASVGLRVNMPEHDMGQQSPEAKEQAAGVYRAPEVVLGMHGEWQVEVVALTKEGREIRYPFRVEVPLPLGQ